MHTTKFNKMSMALMLLGLTSLNSADISVTVDLNHARVVGSTDKWFLSLGMDSNLIRNRWETFDFTSDRLQTLAKGLSPAYLRLSGTDADRMLFKRDCGESCPGGTPELNPDGRPTNLHPFPATNFTMSAEDWDKINIFCKNVGWRIIFGFNAQLRKPWLHGSMWDPENALELLKYTIDKGYAGNLDFQLGNEPDLFYKHEQLEILSGYQLARDYNLLAELLRTDLAPHFSSSELYGPSLANSGPYTEHILKDFLNNIDGDVLEAVTWHQYYGGSEVRHVENYTDPTLLDTYVSKCRRIVDIVSSTDRPDIEIWQGETSSIYAHPGSNICESYVAGFMLLDKLGVSARCGMSVVIRQTFYGFWFALVNKQLEPTPNYWIALLYHLLVGPEVLDIDVTLNDSGGNMNNGGSLRFYSHCLSKSSEYYSPGAVVVYGMNLLEKDVLLDFGKGSEVIEFILSPADDDLQSRSILMNGDPVRMPSDSNLPNLRGRVALDPVNVKLPSKRLAFYIIKDANVSTC